MRAIALSNREQGLAILEIVVGISPLLGVGWNHLRLDRAYSADWAPPVWETTTPWLKVIAIALNVATLLGLPAAIPSLIVALRVTKQQKSRKPIPVKMALPCHVFRVNYIIPPNAGILEEEPPARTLLKP